MAFKYLVCFMPQFHNFVNGIKGSMVKHVEYSYMRAYQITYVSFRNKILLIFLKCVVFSIFDILQNSK